MAHFFMARFGRDLPAYDLPAGVTIRTFAPGDEETFLRCCAGGELGTESWSLDDVREKLLGKPGVAPERVFFAEDAQGRAGATATAVFEEGRGYVHMVAADPSFRGKGLGKAACYAAVRCLVDAGYDYIVLETDDFRAPALHIYDWLGFVRTGVPDRVREALAACGLVPLPEEPIIERTCPFSREKVMSFNTSVRSKLLLKCSTSRIATRPTSCLLYTSRCV